MIDSENESPICLVESFNVEATTNESSSLPLIDCAAGPKQTCGSAASATLAAALTRSDMSSGPGCRPSLARPEGSSYRQVGVG